MHIHIYIYIYVSHTPKGRAGAAERAVLEDARRHLRHTALIEMLVPVTLAPVLEKHTHTHTHTHTQTHTHTHTQIR